MLSSLSGRASQQGPGGPTGFRNAGTWGPQKNAELHMYDEGIDNKCMLHVTN